VTCEPGRPRRIENGVRRAFHAALSFLIVLAACTPDADDGVGVAPGGQAVALAPGSDLLADPARWRWTERPAIELPTGAGSAAEGSMGAGPVLIGERDWGPPRPLPEAFRMLDGVPRDGEVRVALLQVARPAGRGEPRLLVDGRALPPGPAFGTVPTWRSPDGSRLFWWDSATAAVWTVGSGPPGALEVGFAGDDRPGAPTVAAATASAPRVGSVSEFVVDTDMRRGLLAPVPSRCEIDVASIAGGELELVLAVSPVQRARDGQGRVLQVRRGDPAVRFLARLSAGGSAQVLLDRTVRASEGFVRAVAPLPACAGPATLVLSAEEPDAAEGFQLEALWAGLAVLGARAAPDPRPHVVIIDIDTLRADRVGACGGPARNTPRIDAWAARRAVVHLDSLAASNWTLPSTLSMLSGYSVRQHGVLAFPDALPPSAPMLAERLSAAGYATCAVTEGGYVGSAFGFARGFDRFVRCPFQQPDWSAALEWAGQRASAGPVLVFLQTYMVHAPWRADARFEDPAAPYEGPLADRDLTHDVLFGPFRSGELLLDEADRACVSRQYDAAVRRMDDHVGDFLEALERVLDPRTCLVILTSDHGEELFDHGMLEHGHSLYRELLAVPLLVADPQRPPGRDEAPASGLDLVPTVLAAAGFPIPADLPGRPLRDAPSVPRLRTAQHADTALAADLAGWTLVRGEIRERGVPAGSLQLFDRARDPGELHDVAGAEPERLARLGRMLDEWLAAWPPLGGAMPSAPALSPGVREEIQALGYLGR